MVIKYYCKAENIIKTNLLKLQPLDACDANGIVDALLSVFREYGLKIEKMSGLGTDNASVMVGVRNGVFMKLKQLNSRIILIPCVCHSLQLAVSAAAAAFIPKEIDFIVSETYNWFARSCNRQSNYQKIYKLLNDGHTPLKIIQSCTTRWLSIESAVSRIHQQYLELQTYFNMIEKKENCFKITSLAKLYSNELNLAYICFIRPILQQVQKVNKIFESEKADFVKVLSDLEYLIIVLLKKIVKENIDNVDDIDIAMDLDQAELQLKPYLGSECEDKLYELKANNSISSEKEFSFRSTCKEFFIKLIKEL